MLLWIIAAIVLLLVIGYFALARYAMRLDSQREVTHLYENVEWNTEAAEYVQRKLHELKWSIIGWMAAMLVLQSFVLFLAIIYLLENIG